MTSHAVVARAVLLADRFLERTDEVERVISDNDIPVLRAGELAPARLIELAKQGANVGRVARGGR